MISLSESLLVEYLDYDSGRWSNGDIKVLVPSWTQTLFHRVGGVCLIGVNGDDSEWVWKTENLSFYKRVGGKDSDSNGLRLLPVRHLEQPPGVLVSNFDWEWDGERTRKEGLSQVEVERSILERYAEDMTNIS